MKANQFNNYVRTILVAIAVLALNAPFRQGYAQRATRPASTPSLRNFLIGYLGAPGSEDDRADTRYLSATTDLNGDGRVETIVYLLGNAWCGSGGCSMLILTTQGSHYKVVTQTTITQLPIRLLSTRTNGWQDLGVIVAGGGVLPGYEAKLTFNGREYPSNPTVSPARKLPAHTQGKTLIPSGAQSHAKPAYR